MALTKVLGYRAKSYGFQPLGGRGGSVDDALTSISPLTVQTGTTRTFTFTGTGFKVGMVARFWDGTGTFKGTFPCTSITATSAQSAPTMTGWATGTGGVDLWDAATPTVQKQFQITP